VTLLKQSTAVDIALGPFLDETDGKTAETALTITQPDIRLKKNGGAWAQKNAAQTLTHEENGWYEVSLDTTDTNTLGELIVAIHESGALPVWRVFQVVPAHVYDGLVAGSDKLQVDVAEWLGTAAATPTVAGVPEVDVTHWNGSAVATPDSAGHPKVTIKDGTGTGELDTLSGKVLLQDGAVTAAAIAADAITAAKIADGAIDATTFATGAITAAAIAADAIGASELAADAVTEIQSGLSTLTAAGVRTAVGLASANLDTQLGAIDDFLDTEIASIIATLATISGYLDTEVAAILAAVDTEVAAIKAKTDNLPAAPAATGDIPTSTAIRDAVWAKTLTEPSAVPAVTATAIESLAWLLVLARNKVTQTSTTSTLRNDADSGNIAQATVSDDGSTFVRSEWT
jgi:hypothetical protein